MLLLKWLQNLSWTLSHFMNFKSLQISQVYPKDPMCFIPFFFFFWCMPSYNALSYRRNCCIPLPSLICCHQNFINCIILITLKVLVFSVPCLLFQPLLINSLLLSLWSTDPLIEIREPFSSALFQLK